jgi:DNA-binding NtrC family response regulator
MPMIPLADRSSTSILPPDGDQAWILIVDDQPGDRETLRDVFVEKGCHVETAPTGRQALEKARGRFFQVAIIDVRLPDMNGMEVLVQLNTLQPEICAVMVTGYASLQTAIKAVRAGASEYLLKPLDLDCLLSVTEQGLARQRSLVESRRLLDQYRQRIQDLESREDELSERVQQLDKEIAALRRPGG